MLFGKNHSPVGLKDYLTRVLESFPLGLLSVTASERVMRLSGTVGVLVLAVNGKIISGEQGNFFVIRNDKNGVLFPRLKS